MAEAVALTEDGERALQEAQLFGMHANVAILAAEHLLGGALAVLVEAGATGLPSRDQIRSAIDSIHGTGDGLLDSNVMWGSAARDALNMTAAALAQSGQSRLTAAAIARGVIVSGEITPMFFSSLGTSKAALAAAIPA